MASTSKLAMMNKVNSIEVMELATMIFFRIKECDNFPSYKYMVEVAIA